jgi:hypothetical protein
MPTDRNQRRRFANSKVYKETVEAHIDYTKFYSTKKEPSCCSGICKSRLLFGYRNISAAEEAKPFVGQNSIAEGTTGTYISQKKTVLMQLLHIRVYFVHNVKTE